MNSCLFPWFACNIGVLKEEKRFTLDLLYGSLEGYNDDPMDNCQDRAWFLVDVD